MADDDYVTDFASNRPDPGCVVLGLQVLLLVVAVASFGWAFMAGLGPITFVGLAGFGANMATPIAVGCAATVLLVALGRGGSRGR